MLGWTSLVVVLLDVGRKLSVAVRRLDAAAKRRGVTEKRGAKLEVVR